MDEFLGPMRSLCDTRHLSVISEEVETATLAYTDGLGVYPWPYLDLPVS